MDKRLKNISTTMSYALRHNPFQYGITLDKFGWTDLNKFILNLRKDNNCKNLTLEDVKQILKIESEEKDLAKRKIRYEIKDGKIRALYGHSKSLGILIEKTPSEPPEILYHGTTKESAGIILSDMLRHMDRQRVHLSLDIETAINVAKRRTKNPVILKIRAKEAFKNGIMFYKETSGIFQSDDIPAKYIEVLKI